MVVSVKSHLASLLQQTTDALNQQLRADDRQILTDLEDCYLRSFFPFIEEVTTKLCPVQQVAAVLGISLQEANNLFLNYRSFSGNNSFSAKDEIPSGNTVTNGHSEENGENSVSG